MCPQKFGRIARANACLNGHFQRKPYACDKTCGDSNWSVMLLERAYIMNSAELMCFLVKKHMDPLNYFVGIKILAKPLALHGMFYLVLAFQTLK
jgi:hypothetical protein